MIEEIDEIEKLKGNFELCIQILKNITDEAGIDLDRTKFRVQVADQYADMSIGEMIKKWETLLL